MIDATNESRAEGVGAGVASHEAARDACVDARFFAHAQQLAERGRGRVEPNPVVGALLVRDSAIVGEGWHAQYGGPHAEVAAIAAAGERALGATLYVTLEPCNHHGKTPPCVDAILAAGVRRVVYALTDPNPVARGGAERLRAAGIPSDLAADEGTRAAALRANAPFVKRVRRMLPFVTLKWAMSLDGKIATRTGDARWVSGEDSRRLAHEWRDRPHAVLVGIGTALADDPRLTTRLEGALGRTPLRVVVDAKARLPIDSQLVRSIAAGPVIVATTEDAPAERVERLRAAGVEVLSCGAGPAGVDLARLAKSLAARDARPVPNLLVEGGGRIAASLLAAGLVDRLAVFVAPKVIGGESAPSPVGGPGCARMAEALAAARTSVRAIGEDVLIEADLVRPESY